MAEFSELKGKTIASIELKSGDTELEIKTSDGDLYTLMHLQNCCENVYLYDVCGDFEDLIGSPIVVAEEVINETKDLPPDDEYSWCDSWTWSFYKLDTVKGGITMRWFGSSNGFYGETVELIKEEGYSHA